jgi:hypothetical protein
MINKVRAAAFLSFDRRLATTPPVELLAGSIASRLAVNEPPTRWRTVKPPRKPRLWLR